MSANSNTRAIDNTVDRSGCAVWNRLHSEREDICETLLKESRPNSCANAISNEAEVNTSKWHKELLQARLCKLDDALDRLMGGEYGNCCKCGRWIEDAKLDFDPAIAFCVECWQRQQSQSGTSGLASAKCEPPERAPNESSDDLPDNNPPVDGVSLETLSPFDTIFVRTRFSDYQITLLEPKSGRSLVKGGDFLELTDSVVTGSTFGGCTPRVGWIVNGWRMEMWVDDQYVSTSPVQSFRIEHSALVEPASMLSSAA